MHVQYIALTCDGASMHQIPGVSDARCSGLECEVLAVIAGVMVTLAVIGLGFYGLYKIRPGWLRIHAAVWRLITFSLEIGQSGHLDQPADSKRSPEQHRRLEAGHDRPRELEAGHGLARDSAEPSDTADQGDTAA